MKKSFAVMAASLFIAMAAGTLLGDNVALAAGNRIINVSLKPTNQTGLTNFVYETVDPASTNFHKYLSSIDFQTQFGQPDNFITSFENYLNKFHLTTSVYAGNLAIKVSGSQANLVKAFNAKYVNKGFRGYTAYKLPAQLSNQVVAVIGLYGQSDSSKTKSSKSPKKSSNSQEFLGDVPLEEGIKTPNTTLGTKTFSQKYGPLKFADHYDLTPLYDKNLNGSGQRIGIISGSDFDENDLPTYWHQVCIDDSLSNVSKTFTIDSQSTLKKAGSGLTGARLEITLDAEQTTSVAPGAKVDIYIGDSTDGNTSQPSSFYTSFMQAVANDRDKQITSSFFPGIEISDEWSAGSSESLKQYNNAFNIMLEQAAAEGITVFTASGDHGPYEEPSNMENHAFPTSPYLVSVGGTTLPYQEIINDKVITVPKERAWGDTYSLSAKQIKDSYFNGSGGGFSSINPLPPYQEGVSGVGTYRGVSLLKYVGINMILNNNPQILTGSKPGRNIPDVSGDADMRTGYATYLTQKSGGKWEIGGGTSYVAPQMAAANAVMNSGQADLIGFWNPQIYKFAVQSDSPFTVLDDADNNTNLFYTGQPGKLYNQATGLGTIDFAKLAQDFSSEK